MAPRIDNHAPRAAAREEATRLVRLAAEPRAPGEKIKTSIARAAIRLGWSYARTEDIWRGEARRIESWEMDRLRETRRAQPQRRRPAPPPAPGHR